MLPKLDYCGAVSDPYQCTPINKLESVQKVAGKVVCKVWKTSYSSLLNKCKWQSLSTQKITKSKGLLQHHEQLISPSTFTLHPSPSPRHPHNCILFMLLTKTNSHRFSFFCGRSTTLEFPPLQYKQQSLTYHLQTSLRTCAYL